LKARPKIKKKREDLRRGKLNSMMLPGDILITATIPQPD